MPGIWLQPEEKQLTQRMTEVFVSCPQQLAWQSKGQGRQVGRRKRRVICPDGAWIPTEAWEAVHTPPSTLSVCTLLRHPCLLGCRILPVMCPYLPSPPLSVKKACGTCFT